MTKSKKKIWVIAVCVIAAALIVAAAFFIAGKIRKSHNTLSSEQLSEYFDYDLSGVKIVDASIVRSSDVFYTDGEKSDGSVLLVKLSATDEQLQKMTDSLTFGDVSVPPGDLRVFEKYGIETDNIEKKGTSWNEYEEKKLFSTTNKPYSMNWYFLNSGTAEDYNVVVIAVLPFQA